MAALRAKLGSSALCARRLFFHSANKYSKLLSHNIETVHRGSSCFGVIKQSGMVYSLHALNLLHYV